jgi:formylglycine-generating enzyme required for sulfatase activity/predicted Ser/Thr protein kinase
VVKQLAYQAQGTWAANKAKDLFEQEAKQLQRLNANSQIPTLLAYFEEAGSLYLVQEFIDGGDLLKELQEKGAFSETLIRELLLDVLPILKFIHEKGVIHRDLKPENIMRRRDDGKLILIDFGVAKLATPSMMTRMGTQIGSQGYASLEQMLHGQANPSTDLFSLGASCFHLLSQTHPYNLCIQKGYDWVNSWREQVSTQVRPELGNILDKLLKSNPEERYKSETEVLDDLQPPYIVNPPIPKPSIPTIIIPQPVPTPPATPHFQLQQFEFEVVTLQEVPTIKVIEERGFWGNKTTRETTQITLQTQRNRHQAHFFQEDLGNGVTLDMVEIPGGRFNMGSPASEAGRSSDESPQHQVTLSPFLMGKFTVTQAQWEAVASLPKVERDLKPDPSRFKGKNRPVERISWYDAVEFCARLSQKTGKTYRLPSEAEWEYACRAETTTPFHFGATITTDLANYNGNVTYGSAPKGKYRETTTDVGTFPPNAFGLYDMHGNVWEWCADVWHENYNGAPVNGSVWSAGGDNSRRILRGGSWDGSPRYCRSARRLNNSRVIFFNLIGFRVVGVFGRLLSYPKPF